jgi:hypothetical protein
MLNCRFIRSGSPREPFSNDGELDCGLPLGLSTSLFGGALTGVLSFQPFIQIP